VQPEPLMMQLASVVEVAADGLSQPAVVDRATGVVGQERKPVSVLIGYQLHRYEELVTLEG
jgi:hypothetical protein